jgi:hypothetical protein
MRPRRWFRPDRNRTGVGRGAGRRVDEVGAPAFKVLGARACRRVLRAPGARWCDRRQSRSCGRRMAATSVSSDRAWQGDAPQTAARISEEGAKVVWVDYDTAVRRAAEFADEQPGRCWSRTPLGRATSRCRPDRGGLRLAGGSTPSSSSRRIWWRFRSGSGPPRRSCGTTDARTGRIPASFSRTRHRRMRTGELDRSPIRTVLTAHGDGRSELRNRLRLPGRCARRCDGRRRQRRRAPPRRRRLNRLGVSSPSGRHPGWSASRPDRTQALDSMTTPSSSCSAPGNHDEPHCAHQPRPILGPRWS